MSCFRGLVALRGNFYLPLLRHNYFIYLLLLSYLILSQLNCHNFLKSKNLINLVYANLVNFVETLKYFIINLAPIFIKSFI